LHIISSKTLKAIILKRFISVLKCNYKLIFA
jgi:hypothetical protein